MNEFPKKRNHNRRVVLINSDDNSMRKDEDPDLFTVEERRGVCSGIITSSSSVAVSSETSIPDGRFVLFL